MNMSDGLNMLPRIGEPETSLGSSEKPAGGLFAFLAANIPDTSGPPPTPNVQAPGRWIYDFDPASGMARATFNGLVTFTEGGSEGAGVTSWNGQTGAVVMTNDDITAAGGLSNPDAALEGSPTAPTPPIGDSSARIATTQFVGIAIANAPKVSTFNGRSGAVSLNASDITGAGGAPSASPALTGTPTAPTASVGDTSSQIATDAFVANALASGAVTSFNGRHGTVALSLSDVESVGGAPIASPNFTGTPSGPTAAPGTATTALASTAFVMAAITSGTAGVASVNTRTGAVVLNAADLAAMGGAPSLSPTFTGTPHAPTPSAGDNSTLIATTAYVETALGSLPAGVSTFNGRTGTVTLALADVTSVGGAPLASPTFTGSPLATTAPPGDNSTRIADTAFVAAAIAALPPLPAASTATPLMDGTASPGSSGAFAQGDHVHPTDTSRAAASALANYLPLAGGHLSGALTGTSASFTGAVGGGNATFNAGTFASTISTATNGLFYWTAPLGTVLQNGNGSHYVQLDNGGNFAYVGGTGTAIKTGGGPWTAASDDRIKTVTHEYDKGLDDVLALRPVAFVYLGNDTPTDDLGLTSPDPTRAPYEGAAPFPGSPHYGAAQEGREFIGFVAQELEQVFPAMVSSVAGYIDGEPVEDMRQVNVGELVYALVNAVKTLAARIEQLEATP